MLVIIRQGESTAEYRRVPVYMLDDADGKTPETGLTFSSSDVKISKRGGAEANSAGTVTEVAGGLYYYTFTAGELDTVGFITARFIKSGCRTFVAQAMVGAVSLYDPLGVQANVTAINSDTTAAGVHQAMLSLGATAFAVNGVTGAGDFTITGSGVGSTDNMYNGAFLWFTTGANRGIARSVTQYTGSTRRVQMASVAPYTDRPFPFTPSASDAGYIVGLTR